MQRSQQKTAASPKDAAAVFPQQRTPKTVLAALAYFLPSRSPDLRITSFVQPSQISPMTGFRLAQNLHAYSGGTVRDLHPVPYSSAGLLPPPQTLKGDIHFADIGYHQILCLSTFRFCDKEEEFAGSIIRFHEKILRNAPWQVLLAMGRSYCPQISESFPFSDIWLEISGEMRKRSQRST